MISEKEKDFYIRNKKTEPRVEMIEKKPIYLDYNASTPIDPKVLEEMLPYFLHHYGNPSSYHIFGVGAKKGIDRARRQVAEMINCKIDEIVFTSGGTESNNFAIRGITEAGKNGSHIITSSVEHPAVIEVCKNLELSGVKVTYLKVDGHGLIDLNELQNSITPATVLISIMHANNEIGTIMPIKEISEIAKKHKVLFHCDAAQSAGKIAIDVEEMGIDLLSLAGHKFYAPKGVGALFIKRGVVLKKLLLGAGQENNRRAGTENVTSIIGLGKAASLVEEQLEKHSAHLKKLRDRFEKTLNQKIDGIKINGHPEKRLPNTSSISVKNIDANSLLRELKGVAASAGAACHSHGTQISSVLEAIGLPLEYAMGTIRFSFGRFTTEQEIDTACDEIEKIVLKLRN